MEGPTPQLRLTSPFGSPARCMQFARDGHLLLVGDAGGTACIFDLTARRPVSLLSPSEAQAVPASPIGLPFGAEASPFADRKETKNNSSRSPLLHIEPLNGSSSPSRFLLQQKDSRLSLFDLETEKFMGALRTGAFSFCKCASPETSIGGAPLDSSRDSSCLLGTDCVAAPTGELETAGLFDLRVSPSTLASQQQTTPPVLALRLPVEEARRAFCKENLCAGAGSLQGLGFPSSAYHLLAAYELPSLALWDLRHTKGPLSFEALPHAQSPPTDIGVAGQRAWLACVEGELQILRIAKIKSKKSESREFAENSNAAQCTRNHMNGNINGNTNSNTASNTNSSSTSNDHSSTGNGRVTLHHVANACVFGRRQDAGRPFKVPSSCGAAFVDFQHLDTDKLHLTSLALRADGLLGACGSSAGHVHLYEGKALRFMGSLKGHHTAVSAVSWSSTNALLASADKEGVVHIWDVYRESYTRPMRR